LIDGYRPQMPLLVSAAKPLSHADFLARADVLAKQLSTARFIINLCESRLNFMLGFAAALLRGMASLLPPDRTQATVAGISRQYHDSFILRDSDVDAIVSRLPDTTTLSWDKPCPMIPADQIAAMPFTSGSTGTPVAHEKTWGGLVAHARLLSQRLDLAGTHIVATVPPQHTYGLEASVVAALAGGAIVHCARPFFPQDVADSLSTLPAPRLLVTTPVHLRALIHAGIQLPPLAAIVSATAPLAADLAQASERELGTALYEIYGSTESGAIATRRTVAGALWQPLPGVSFCSGETTTWVKAPHLHTPVQLADLIETHEDGCIRLLGRSNDLIKVAGKRMSLAELNRLLLAIPGVEDGAVFMPDTDPAEAGTVVRPAAVVVAPSLSERDLLDALRRCIDPAFLPRPLRRVSRLPRNDVGKLPLTALRDLIRP
jgi:acyl-coenzyme A synthetase/AMP-(fatty) acid ligase